MIVDLATMILFMRTLRRVVIMRSEVSTSAIRIESMSPTDATEGLPTKSATEKHIVRIDSEYKPDEITRETTKVKAHVDRHSDMFSTMARMTLLSCFGIASSFGLHIYMFVAIVNNANMKSDGVMIRAISNVDGAVNCICMYLMFAFAKPYYAIGCKVCHIGMARCCKKITKRA